MNNDNFYYNQLVELMKDDHWASKFKGANNLKDLKRWINEKTPLLQDDDYPLGVKVYWVINHMTDFPKCIICGNPIGVKRFKLISQTRGYPKYCCSECKRKDKKIVERRISTCKTKYGVENPMQVESIKILNNTDHKPHNYEKCFKTFSTMRYNQFINSSTIPMFTLEEFQNLCKGDMENQYRIKFTWKCKRCGKIFKSYVRRALFKNDPVRCYDCYPRLNGTSENEREIRDYIQSIYNGRIYYNARNILKGRYEIDIYLPDIKLAFEYDGLYWHSVGRTAIAGFKNNKKEYYKFRQLLKSEECDQYEIKLIHIYENEWLSDKDITKNKIKSIILNNVDLSLWNIDLTKDTLRIDRRWFSKKLDNGLFKNYILKSIVDPLPIYWSDHQHTSRKFETFSTPEGLDSPYCTYDCGYLIYQKSV